MVDKDTPLFSESVVNQIVTAKIERDNAMRDLLEEKKSLERITVDRTKTIDGLQKIEKEILEKHKQAVAAWKKAYKVYADFVAKNPGSNAMNRPGEEPKLGDGIERVRGWIRGFSAVTDDKIVFTRDNFFTIFKDGSQAIANMRAVRDQYVTMVSGNVMNMTALNASSTSNVTFR